MSAETSRTIRIAAALIDDDAGRLLLVRKVGTEWFMQAGGKIEEGESPVSALRRELNEKIGLVLADDDPRHLGRYSAPAANEPGYIIDAEIFRPDAACSSHKIRDRGSSLGRSRHSDSDVPGTINPRPHLAAIVRASIRGPAQIGIIFAPRSRG